MVFARKFDPTNFPFAINEKPLSLEKGKDLEDRVVGALKPIENQVFSLEEKLARKIDGLASMLLDFTGTIANSDQSPHGTEEEMDAKDDELILALLPIMDGLEASFLVAERSNAEGLYGETFEKTRLAYLELEKIFKKLNISKIPSVGKELDSRVHIPVGIANETGLPDYTITKEESAGYVRNGRVIRQAKVIVAKNEG